MRTFSSFRELCRYKSRTPQAGLDEPAREVFQFNWQSVPCQYTLTPQAGLEEEVFQFRLVNCASASLEHR